MLWSNFKSIAVQLVIGLGCTVIGAGFTSVYTHTSQSIKSCASAVESSVSIAEKLLIEGDLDGAQRYSDDALILAPHDECTTSVAAEVQARRMMRARETGNAAVAESARLLCYRYAANETGWGSASPRRKALSTVCRASSSDNVAVVPDPTHVRHQPRHRRAARHAATHPAADAQSDKDRMPTDSRPSASVPTAPLDAGR